MRIISTCVQIKTIPQTYALRDDLPARPFIIKHANVSHTRAARKVDIFATLLFVICEDIYIYKQPRECALSLLEQRQAYLYGVMLAIYTTGATHVMECFDAAITC